MEIGPQATRVRAHIISILTFSCLARFTLVQQPSASASSLATSPPDACSAAHAAGRERCSVRHSCHSMLSS
jgi:hypothetical protein